MNSSENRFLMLARAGIAFGAIIPMPALTPAVARPPRRPASARRTTELPEAAPATPSE